MTGADQADRPSRDLRLDIFGTLWLDRITLGLMDAVFTGGGALPVFGKEDK